ncbi:Bug family tripartite tricarboxylate transporter substrate binding protein [Pelagibacterium luteolum]|uniref:Tripartite-type tricarboxylate transporter, receptor component TctC n=1 Tax=Pelagibacterium luteolum TaxID=440168 RepID=A0A1G8ACH5_9HYPH|nr:tripartite tricarboxylate transporter substrate binding protein [Pelagibacterium luteolum]SDH18040.1 Tripartite-type tricarboxylate transporter, receptor component TctC [Pelagibacterium luteolum]
MKILVSMLAVLSAFGATTAVAQYPERAVQLIVPFAAGGPIDGSGRLVASALSELWSNAVVIDNRPGAGGAIGTQEAIQAEPDGYRLLLGSFGPLVIAPAIGQADYDVLDGLVPVSLVSRSPQVLAVSASVPIESIEAFIAYAQDNPFEISVASAGLATSPHLAIELMAQEAGIDVVHIPYRGTSMAIPDVLGGTVQAIMGDVATLAGPIKDGGLRPLAITAAERLEQFPDVPTMAESGLPTVASYNWSAIFAPRDTPVEIIEQISQAVIEVSAQDSYRELMLGQGISPLSGTPEETLQYFQDEVALWSPIIANIEIE